MGTNYYASADACPHCGRGDTEIHIGKSSFGWEFLFEAHEDRGLTSWKAWREFLAHPATKIRNEYDEAVSLAELEALIERKRGGRVSQTYDVPDAEGYRFSTSKDFC